MTPILNVGPPKEWRATVEEVAQMRMRDQLVVIVAVAVATIAVAANVFAQTHAANQRVEMEREGLAAAWSYPVMDTTTSTNPIEETDTPSRETSDGDDGDHKGQTETWTPSDDAVAPCSDEAPCTIEEVLDHDFRNHGQMVSAYVRALGFEEGLDGPWGSSVRQIAKPDIDSDGPPRSDRALENQDKNDDRVPPGQDNEDDRVPPGQDKDKDDD